MNSIYNDWFDKYTNAKYLSKQELLYRIKNSNQDSFPKMWDYFIKLRRQKGTILPLKDESGEAFWFMTPPFINKKLNQIDSVAKRRLEEIVSEDIHKELLLESMFDEAFYSSVIEGAFSTKKRAKEVVINKQPRDKSEQMILNNYEAMMYVLENMDYKISEENIIELHKILTKNTLDEDNKTDKYRHDIVFVRGSSGEIIYEAPPHELVQEMMSNLIRFINENDDSKFIHPMIKAAIIHFYIGYVHPFFDGNGRVARALAYMYLIKNGYDFFKFFSISYTISKHKKRYYKSYLLSEEPEKDITYFISTQIDMTIDSIYEVIDKLSSIYNEELLYKKLDEDQVFLSNRQNKFLKYITRKSSNFITVKDYQKRFKIVYETARKDLNELESLGILKKIKKGRTFIYVFQGVIGYMDKN